MPLPYFYVTGLYGFGSLNLTSGYQVYVVDDEEGIRELLVELCEDKGIACRGFADGEAFLAVLDELEPGCVLLDMRLPRRNGLQVQAEIIRRERPLQVITITGYADVDMAVESMKMGAVDFLEKPFLNDVLFDALERGFSRLSETNVPPASPA